MVAPSSRSTRAAVPVELWREGRDLATISGRRVKDDGEETQDGKTQEKRWKMTDRGWWIVEHQERAALAFLP